MKKTILLLLVTVMATITFNYVQDMGEFNQSNLETIIKGNK